MKLRDFYTILILVGALAAVSCTNEELIVEASQSPRGRAFAEAFKARFDNIDPNHTWIDGTVGKVMVTTDEKANIVIYGIGRSDGTLLRLKRCVVEGTQEVHYDIPMGCKKVVIRAWNEHGNEYKTLDPTNENDEATLLISTGTRASHFTDLSPYPRQLIPNVWNEYGVMAPWQTDIPNIPGILAKFDTNTADADLGWCFYFKGPDNNYHNINMPSKPFGYANWLPTSLFTSDSQFESLTGLSSTEYEKISLPNHALCTPPSSLTPNLEYITSVSSNIWSNNNGLVFDSWGISTTIDRSLFENAKVNDYIVCYIKDKDNSYNPIFKHVDTWGDFVDIQNYIEHYYDDRYKLFIGKIGTTEALNELKRQGLRFQGRGFTLLSVDLVGTPFPGGEYYAFSPYGKRGSWWAHKRYDSGNFNVEWWDDYSEKVLKNEMNSYGKFYVTNGMLENNTNNSYFYNPRGDYENYYNIHLNNVVLTEIKNIMNRAEGNYEVLYNFNQDAGIKTTLEGPVSISWLITRTSTRDYIGYYYTDDEHPDPDSAPKYLLMEGTCTNRTEGDTFPLTFYGFGEDDNTCTYTFPAGVNIHFFVLHGRDSSANNPNPHSGWSSWRTGDPARVEITETYINDEGEEVEETFNIGDPSEHSNRVDWLFYDTNHADRIWDEEYGRWATRTGDAPNGWTLNAFYCCYSHAGIVNNTPLNRIQDTGAWNADYATPSHEIYDYLEGNYKPMVAFKYAGYNVIGFEDTPWQNYGNTLDWNDCVFIVNGNFDIPDFSEKDLAFSMCMEDLGDTDDLDYNDLYMIVIQGYEEIHESVLNPETGEHEQVVENTLYQTPKVIVDMAGGVYQLKISYEDDMRSHLNQILFDDVHKAFGRVYANDENKYVTDGRSTINTFDPGSYDDNVTHIEPAYQAGEVSDVFFTDGAIVRCTNVRGLGDEAANGHIETWFDANKFSSEDISSFSIIENIPNFKVRVTYDDGEEVLISGPKDVEVKIGGNTSDRIPYAFWFPSTAESEEESNENPDSRVHPGFERQFIGDYLDGFVEWVANQHAEGKNNWYNWQWGNSSAYEDFSPSGGGSGQTPTGFSTTTFNINASSNPNRYDIPASAFSGVNTTVYVKLNYTDTEHGKSSSWLINGQAINGESGIFENYCTESLTSHIAKLKRYGLTILWDSSDGQTWNIPSSIQIIYK